MFADAGVESGSPESSVGVFVWFGQRDSGSTSNSEGVKRHSMVAPMKMVQLVNSPNFVRLATTENPYTAKAPARIKPRKNTACPVDAKACRMASSSVLPWAISH